jgi:hypothetical protein
VACFELTTGQGIQGCGEAKSTQISIANTNIPTMAIEMYPAISIQRGNMAANSRSQEAASAGGHFYFIPDRHLYRTTAAQEFHQIEDARDQASLQNHRTAASCFGSPGSSGLF